MCYLASPCFLIVSSAKTIGNKAHSFVLSTPDKMKRNDNNVDEVTPVMLYADADIITTMERGFGHKCFYKPNK